MRTKTLYLTALLGAASIATSVAQTVYSVNAVGYVNVTFKSEYTLVANPLVAETNTVAVLFDAAPSGTTVYKYNVATTSYDSANKNKLTGKWNNLTMTLLPGEGAFVKNTGTADFTITFVGEVLQGTLTNTLPLGYSIASSQVPQAGLLQTDLAFPAVKGDTVYKFVSGAYVGYNVNNLTGKWSPSEPSVAVAESFFVKKKATVDWTRTFSVNQ